MRGLAPAEQLETGEIQPKRRRRWKARVVITHFTDSQSAGTTGTPSNSPEFTSSNAPDFTSSNAPDFTSSNAPDFTSSNALDFTTSNAPDFTPSTPRASALVYLPLPPTSSQRHP
ncbi:hypothetical protein HBI18_241210 [Parastagonospora nodorum]|nr:hypothetical protein HBI18_241210 [Parastagonospora nodorum]